MIFNNKEQIVLKFSTQHHLEEILPYIKNFQVMIHSLLKSTE